MRDRAGLLLAAAAAPLFCVLAIANSAGYRYGVSDLAFYLPAAFRHVDPRLFPRDRSLLEVQAPFTGADEALGWMLGAGRALGADAPAVVYALHVATLLLLFGAAVSLGGVLFRSRWSVAAFVAALTLRHAVARTGVNTLEGYFHPRILAFALVVLGVSCLLRGATATALALGLAAMAVHTTTGFWFLICGGVAALVSERRLRLPLLSLAVVGAVFSTYAITLGPLGGRLRPMDPAWLAVLADRDYLFPDRWPASAWLTCAAYVLAIATGTAARVRAGELSTRERGLLAGAAALILVFVTALPLLAARSALAVQLQPARVFWILDLVATAAVIWIAESARVRSRAVPVVLAVVLIAASTIRGVYLVTLRFPERSLAQVTQPGTPWEEVMRWASTRTDPSSHWLAHPSHAFVYGSSLRVTGRRDVFIEGTKDPAVAMYDRRVAMRVAERLPLVSDFDQLTMTAIRTLTTRYDLDFIVTEQALPLPVAYERPPLRVYRLR